MSLVGPEPAIFGSEDQCLIHQATGPRKLTHGKSVLITEAGKFLVEG